MARAGTLTPTERNEIDNYERDREGLIEEGVFPPP
jgi:hypothetical protein